MTDRAKLMQNVRDAISALFIDETNPTPELAKKEITQLRGEIDVILANINGIIELVKETKVANDA